MLENTTSKQPTIMMVEWQKDGERISVVLALDVKALLTLAAKPLAGGLNGGTVFKELKSRGAVLNDAIGGDGAVIPAVQFFDAETGNRTLLQHYQAGNLQDPARGEPAWQEFAAKTGIIFSAVRYPHGERPQAVSEEELIQLRLRLAAGTVALPESLRKYARPGLRPA